MIQASGGCLKSLVTQNGELALSSSLHPCDRGPLSVGECLNWYMPCAATSRTTTHATSGGCCASVELAGKAQSLPKWIVVVICNTQIPVTTNKAVYAHKCIYTQANTCVHINTCLSPSESLNAIMYKRSLLSLEVICCIPAAKTKVLNWKFSLHRWDKHVCWACV